MWEDETSHYFSVKDKISEELDGVVSFNDPGLPGFPFSWPTVHHTSMPFPERDAV